MRCSGLPHRLAHREYYAHFSVEGEGDKTPRDERTHGRARRGGRLSGQQQAWQKLPWSSIAKESWAAQGKKWRVL